MTLRWEPCRGETKAGSRSPADGHRDHRYVCLLRARHGPIRRLGGGLLPPKRPLPGSPERRNTALRQLPNASYRVRGQRTARHGWFPRLFLRAGAVRLGFRLPCGGRRTRPAQVFQRGRCDGVPPAASPRVKHSADAVSVARSPVGQRGTGPVCATDSSHRADARALHGLSGSCRRALTGAPCSAVGPLPCPGPGADLAFLRRLLMSSPRRRMTDCTQTITTSASRSATVLPRSSSLATGTRTEVRCPRLPPGDGSGGASRPYFGGAVPKPSRSGAATGRPPGAASRPSRVSPAPNAGQPNRWRRPRRRRGSGRASRTSAGPVMCSASVARAPAISRERFRPVLTASPPDDGPGAGPSRRPAGVSRPCRRRRAWSASGRRRA